RVDGQPARARVEVPGLARSHAADRHGERLRRRRHDAPRRHADGAHHRPRDRGPAERRPRPRRRAGDRHQRRSPDRRADRGRPAEQHPAGQHRAVARDRPAAHSILRTRTDPGQPPARMARPAVQQDLLAMISRVAVLSLAVLAGLAARAAAQPQPDAPAPVHAPESTITTVRVGDVARFQGAAPIPLVGYGLVVGLNKTGDRRQTIFPAQTLANMLERFGVAVPAEAIKIENVAAVLVTAELPPFVRQGARLDVTASSIGDARSLQGGTLVPTPLRGPDGTVYALAQGPLS